jgi:hypothetical protein
MRHNLTLTYRDPADALLWHGNHALNGTSSRRVPSTRRGAEGSSASR